MSTKKPPIEDPIRIAAFTDALASLDWAPDAYKASLEVLFRRLSDLTHAEIRYYYSRRCSSRRVSKVCRFLAWVLGTVGILVPLVHPALGAQAPKEILSWGYIAFGAAGAVMICDTVFAGTQAHQRYTATQLELEKIYTVFALDWQARLLKLTSDAQAESALSTKDATANSALELVDGAVAFANELHRAMGAETSAWQETVNKGLAELKGKIGSASGGAG